MKKLVLALAAIILAASVILGFSSLQYVSEDGSIKLEGVEVRVGRLDYVKAEPASFRNPLFNLIRGLAWYKPSSGANTITTQYYGSFSDYHPPARRTFYASGRTWYIGWWPSGVGGNIFYASSADGVTWTVTDTGFRCNRPPVAYFDGTYVHIAFQAYSSLYLCYVRGQPSSDGTITFGSVQNAIATASNYIPLSITVDSNGYPWIGYRYSSDGSSWYPYVTKSSRNDGTWSTPSGFPYQLSTYTDYTWMVEVVALTSGKVAAVYTGQSRSVYVRSWSGSAWNSQVSASTTYASTYSYPWLSAVAVGDVVYIAYPKATAGNPTLVKYTYSSNSVSSVMDLDSSGMSGNTAMLHLCSSSLIYFISTVGGISYKVYNITANSLGSSVTVVSEGVEPRMLTVPYSSSSSPVYVVYGVGSSDPRTVKMAQIVGTAQTQFQVSVSSLQVSGQYVKSKSSGVLGSANVTVRVYHNVDTNSSWVLAGQYNLANDTLLPYSTSFTTPWYNLIQGTFSQGTHTYYFKVEVVVQARDAITGDRVSSTAYVVASTPLQWMDVARLGGLSVVETNMRETWNVPLYASLFSIAVVCSTYIVYRRARERD